MVREVLSDQDLDPTVRALSIERLEASLTERAASALGAERSIAVRIDEEGVPRVFEGDVHIEDAKLSSRLELDLVARLAPTIGLARVDVKRGVRPSKPHAITPHERSAERAPAASVAPWIDVARRLASLARKQNARIAALEAAAGLTSNASNLRDIDQELQVIEAAIEDASRS